MRLADIVFLLLCAAAALRPLTVGGAHGARGLDDSAFEGWPITFEGADLAGFDLSEREAAFAEAFPGKVALFGCAQAPDNRDKLVILRWVQIPTRRLHSSADCLRASGYSIEPRKAMRDAEGHLWAQFFAKKGGAVLRVRERIYAAKGPGEWTDVSAWFWSAASGRSDGPWWGVTVVEQD